MNQFLRIKKLVEAQEQLSEATNLVLAAISGLSIEDQVRKEIVDPLSWIIEPTRNREADPMNIQNVLAFILTGDPKKIYLIADEKIAFKSKEEAEFYINSYVPDVEYTEIELK
jgi:hypothetical protein